MNRIARILHIAESLRTADFRDISALKRYLKNKSFHIYDFRHEFEQYNNFEELLEQANINPEEWNQTVDEEDYDKIEKLSDKVTSSMSEKDKEYFVDYLLSEYSEDAPSWGFLDFESYVLPSNTWLVHFSDHAYSIKQNGFTYGMDQMDKLGLTTYFSDNAKKYGGYNFAFDADSRDASFAARQRKYGKDAVLFKAPGVKAYHSSDQEHQIIFYGKDVNPKDIVLLENSDDGWKVIGGKRGELFTSESFNDAVSWVQSNYRQYQKPLAASTNEFEINENYLQHPVTGYKNPTPKQMNSCKKFDQVRAFLVGKDMYIWEEAVHRAAARALGLLSDSNVIPLNMYLNGSKIGAVAITDFANNTKWHHNPKLKDAILNNKWIKLYADKSDIQDPDFVSYYDSAIYGPWHELKTASENKLEQKIKHILPKLAKKAQEEYDAWDEENVDEYAGGGICHIIADELSDIFSQNDIDSAPITHPFKQHVYNVAFDTETKTAITIDLPDYVYETGGGFSWKKIPDVEITPNDFILDEVNWDDLFDENDELIDF